MAIINCSACGQRISSISTQCEYCKTTFDHSEDDEKLRRKLSNARFAKKQRLQNMSFLSVLAFAAGAIMMYLGITDGDETLNQVGIIILSIGFIGYIITRVLLFLSRRR